eukprot:73231-Chlamydomonas_euryale.AAC.1
MAPSLVLAIVHNADYEHLDELLAMHAHVAVVALSPHVASALTQRTGLPTEWLLPVYPVRPDPDCAAAAAGGGGGSGVVGLCLRGFAMQGKFSNLRRNYTAVWAQMEERLDDIGDPQVGRPMLVGLWACVRVCVRVPVLWACIRVGLWACRACVLCA